MKIKRIRSINIMGIKHKIKYRKITDGNNGYYYNDTIEINTQIEDPKEFMEVLLHESLHGVFEKTGIHQDINLPQEHTIIDSTITFLLANFDIRIKKKK